MSHENVEIVRRIYDAVARRDSVTPFEFYADDIVWDLSNWAAVEQRLRVLPLSPKLAALTLVGTSAVLTSLPLVAAGCGGHSADSPEPEVTLGGTAPERTTTSHRHTSRTTSDQRQVTKPPIAGSAAKPRIRQWLIPFPAKRKQETAAYAQRHYGTVTSRLDPKVIVEHVSVTPTAEAVYNTFANDQPDVELHELPQVCSHFVVDRDGTIYQLVPVKLICRHTVGLNYVAIGIEHVGSTDADVLGNEAQMSASIRLTTWLRCRFGIAISNVIGHAESLSSPYHHENVASLQHQTHGDWQPDSMSRYRARLGQATCAG